MPSLYELQQAGPQPSTLDPVHQKAAAITAAADAATAKVCADGTLSLAGRQAAMARTM